jgi:polyisoprenoid-binding protein YceI
METMLSDRDREDVLKSMRSAKQLDERKYPHITFDSTKVTRLDAGKLEVTGRMGIHGVRKSITLLVSYSIADGKFRGEGSFTFTHKDFGIPTFTAVMGTVRNAEPIRLKILLVGIARAAPDFALDGLAPVPPPAAGK